MAIGIRTGVVSATNTVFAADTTLRTIGLTSPIAANETRHLRVYFVLTLVTAGQFKLQVQLPGAFADYKQSIEYITSGGASVRNIQVTNALFTNNTGGAITTRTLTMDISITNGPTAGNIDIQVAQNVASGSMTIFAGGEMEVVNYGPL